MAPDVLDDLLDFDTNNNDIFRDVDISMDLPSRGKSSLQSENSKDVSGLGIDEEIQVQKKRKPVVRLDEHRSVYAFAGSTPIQPRPTHKSSYTRLQTSFAFWNPKVEALNPEATQIQRKGP